MGLLVTLGLKESKRARLRREAAAEQDRDREARVVVARAAVEEAQLHSARKRQESLEQAGREREAIEEAARLNADAELAARRTKDETEVRHNLAVAEARVEAEVETKAAAALKDQTAVGVQAAIRGRQARSRARQEAEQEAEAAAALKDQAAVGMQAAIRGRQARSRARQGAELERRESNMSDLSLGDEPVSMPSESTGAEAEPEPAPLQEDAPVEPTARGVGEEAAAEPSAVVVFFQRIASSFSKLKCSPIRTEEVEPSAPAEDPADRDEAGDDGATARAALAPPVAAERGAIPEEEEDDAESENGTDPFAPGATAVRASLASDTDPFGDSEDEDGPPSPKIGLTRAAATEEVATPAPAVEQQPAQPAASPATNAYMSAAAQPEAHLEKAPLTFAFVGSFLKCLRTADEPSPEEEPVKPLPQGYLVFSEANGGCFELHWSAEPVEGALASFLPKDPVAETKLTANGGRSELCRGVGGPNVKDFYRGWVSFIKMACKLEASLSLLSNLDKQPVAVYLAMPGLAVARFAQGQTMGLGEVRAVAVVGINADGFNVRTMETQFFLSVGQKLGFSMALEGGAAGAGGVADKQVRLGASDRARPSTPLARQAVQQRALTSPQREQVQLTSNTSRQLSVEEQERAAGRAAEAELLAQAKAESAALGLDSPRSPGLPTPLRSPRASPRAFTPLSSPRASPRAKDEMQAMQLSMAFAREADARMEQTAREDVEAEAAETASRERASAAEKEAAAQRAAESAAANAAWAQSVQGFLKFFSGGPKAEEEPAAEGPPPLPQGYLVFSEANGGCFELHWSAEPVEGALASFLPKDPVAETKLTANGGRSELCRGVGGPNVKDFYRGWVSYIKMACKLEASLSLLSNLDKQPVAVYLAMSGLAVARFAQGQTMGLGEVRAVAVVGINADGFNVRTMETQFFLSVGQKLGFSMALEGGAAGAGGVADKQVRLGASDRARTLPIDGSRRASMSSQATEPELIEELRPPPPPPHLRCFACFAKALPAPPAPPPPPPLPQGYLLFSETNGGSFQLQWSTEPIEGALACFLPKDPVPDFKLTANGGRSELCRGIGGPNVKDFYRGWVSYIKMACKLEASLSLLSNLDKQPVAVYFAMPGLAVARFAQGRTMGLGEVRAVAVVGINADGLNVRVMETQFFVSVGARLGASGSFVEAEAAQRAPVLRATPTKGSSPTAATPTAAPLGDEGVLTGNAAIDRAEQQFRV